MPLLNTDFSRLPPDSSGNRAAMKAATIGGVTIFIPASVLYNEDGTVAAGMRPDGFLHTKLDPTSLLFDTFESLDTTNTWTISGTVNPTGAAGNLTVSAGTVAAGTSFARSQPTFIPASSGYLQVGMIVQLDAAVVTGNTRYWGLGIPAVSPTTGVPVQDGVVFEARAADGLLYASVYSAGALTQSFALTRPTDGLAHRYQIIYKASRAYINLDNVDVASISFPNPAVSALALIIGSINGGSVVSPAATLKSSAMGIADTSKNSAQLSDGVYPWRKATVTSFNELSTLPADRRLTSQALGTVVGNTTTWDANGQADAIVTVTTTRTGTMIFEVSNDGTNWVAAEVYDGGAELWVPGAFVPTAAKNYRVITAGFRTLRARTVTTLSGDPGLVTTLSSTVAMIRAVDTGPAPHQYGYAETGATAQYTAAQTSTVLGPTVAATQFIVVTSIQIQVGGTTAGTLQVYLGTGAYVRGTNKALFDGEFAPSATLKPGYAQAKPTGYKGALDEEIRVTGVGAINPLTVTCWYYLVG